jgi:hypothetical protein
MVERRRTTRSRVRVAVRDRRPELLAIGVLASALIIIISQLP